MRDNTGTVMKMLMLLMIMKLRIIQLLLVVVVKCTTKKTEELEAARSWVAQSEEIATRKGLILWNAVCKILNRRTGENKDVDSVRGIPKRLSKKFMLWIALKSEVD